MSTVLVTGAAGFIGSHTCDHLLSDGHRVIGVDNFSTGKRENISAALSNSRFQIEEFDVTNLALLSACVKVTKPDAIIHLSALVSVPESIAHPEHNFRQNVLAPQGVMDAARKLGVQRIVFASSAAVYGNNPNLPLTERSLTTPISPYGAAKLASEALLIGQGITYGIVVRCMRYFNVYGPRQDPKSPYSGVISVFADRLKAAAAPTIFGDGLQTRDFISVHDVARANAIAATRPNLATGVANICTGRATTLNDLARLLARHFTNVPSPIHTDSRAGDIRHSLGDPEVAKLELGFTANMTIEAGLTELVRSL